MSEGKTRVLWTSNIVLPAVADDLGVERTPFGGWLSLMTSRLAKLGEFRIGVAMRAGVSDFRHVSKDGIDYFALPQRKSDAFDVNSEDCQRVLQSFSPDILHVEGAEMRHAQRFLRNWDGPALLSMQGVLNGYAPYEMGRLPVFSMLSPRHPQIMMSALALTANHVLRFKPRLAHERMSMNLATHIMGRTLWDRAQAYALAPHARYFECSRILRGSFYESGWKGDNCERFSIFVGNGASPRKGLHVALGALALLRRDFPQAKLYVAGEDPFARSRSSLKRRFGYSVYVRHLIRKLDLENSVEFTGVLNEKEIVDRMSRSHVCVMSSIIENSPNTLGEAMILGVPVVSAYCGGAPSMARDEEEALFYRPDDASMLAYQVSRVFSNDDLAGRLSKSGQKRARVTHDPERNLSDLVQAYRAIVAEGSGQ